MTEQRFSVLRVNSTEETDNYRRAVARIIGHVLRDFDMTMVDIADAIDVSAGTVSNAFNRKSDLQAVYLGRIGQVFGPQYLTPYTALFGGRIMPLDIASVDAIPPLAASLHRIACARSPQSEGGETITHRELLDIVPELRAAQRAIGAMLAQADEIVG